MVEALGRRRRDLEVLEPFELRGDLCWRTHRGRNEGEDEGGLGGGDSEVSEVRPGAEGEGGGAHLVEGKHDGLKVWLW